MFSKGKHASKIYIGKDGFSMHKKKLVSRMSAATMAVLMGISSVMPTLGTAEGTLWFKGGNVTLEQANGVYYNYTSKLPFTAYDSPSVHATYGGAVQFRNSEGSTTESIDLKEGGGKHQMVMYEMQGDGANPNLGICLRPTAHSFAAGFFNSDGKLVEYDSTNGYTGYWNKVRETQTGKAIAAAMYYGYGGRVQGKEVGVADTYIATQLIVWELVCGYRDPKTMELVTKDADGNNITTSSSLLDYYKPTAGGEVIRKNSSCKGICDEYDKITKSMKNWAETHNNFPNSLKSTAAKVVLQYDFASDKYTGNVDIAGAKGNWANATDSALKAQWGKDNVSSSGTVYTVSSKSKPSSPAKTTISPINTDEYDAEDSWVIYNHSFDPRKANSSDEDCQDLAFNAQVIDPVEGEVNYVVANYGDLEIEKNWKADSNILDAEKAKDYMTSVSFTVSTTGADGKDYYVKAKWNNTTDTKYTFEGTTTNASEATKFRFPAGADGDDKLLIKDLPSDEDGTEYIVTESVREGSRAYEDGYKAEEPKIANVSAYSLTSEPKTVTVTFTNSKNNTYGQVSLLKHYSDYNSENYNELKESTFAAFAIIDGEVKFFKGLKQSGSYYTIPKECVDDNGNFVKNASCFTTDISEAMVFENVSTVNIGGMNGGYLPVGTKVGYIELVGGIMGYNEMGYVDPNETSIGEQNWSDFKNTVKDLYDSENLNGEMTAYITWDGDDALAPSGINYLVNGRHYPVVFGVQALNVSDLSVLSKTRMHLYNKPYYVTLQVDKKDSKNEALAGAVIGLYKDGKKVAQGTSDAKGKVDFYAVDTAGKVTSDLYEMPMVVKESDGYTYKEISAPSGYLTDTSSYKVSFRKNIDESGVEKAYLGKITNQKVIVNYEDLKPVDITVTKKDNHGDVVEGAEFEVKAVADVVLYEGTPNEKTVQKKGEVVATLTTGKNGTATVEDCLWPGFEYTVTEVNVPKNLVLNNSGKKFTAPEYEDDTTAYSYTMTNNWVQGKVTLTKIDSVTGDALSGATFKLWQDVNKDGKLDDTDKEIGVLDDSDNDGTYVSGQLEYGKYLVKETKAPEGYVPDTNVYPVDISKDGQTVTIGNDTDESGKSVFKEKPIQGKITLTKVNAKDFNQTVSGAVFEVWKDTDNDGALNTDVDEKIIADLKDENGDGVYETGKLRYGQYLVREKTAPAGFVKSKDVVVGIIKKNNDVVEVGNDATADGKKVFKETEIEGSIVVNKVDSDTNEPISGAEFTVWQDVNKDGKLDDGDVEIGKLIEDTEEFYTDEETTDGETNTISDIVGTGTYRIGELKAGQYIVKETIAPENYIIDPNEYVAVIAANGQEVTINNRENAEGFFETEMKATISLYKYDEEYPDNGLEGAKFDVYKDINANNTIDDGDEYLGNMADLGGGNYTMGGLKMGTYLVKETIAPDGFNLDPDTYVAVLSEDGQIVNVTNDSDTGFDKGFKNSPSKGKITLTKYDSRYPDHVLSGAKFDVWKDTNSNGKVDDTDEYLGNLTEITTGIYEMADLRVGDYLVHETEAPEGFNLDNGYYTATIKKDGDIFVVTNRGEDGDFASGFYNDIKRGDIEITKTDIVTSEALPNTGFRIYDKDKNVIFEDYTDENGKIVFKGLEYGEYYYQEYDAPEGYIIDESLYSFEIREDGVVIKAEMTNRPKPASITITKTDISGSETLPNTGIRLCKEDGTVIEEKRTDSNGSVTFEINIEELGYGKYYFEEFDAPEGYLINEEKHWFEITEGGQIIKDTLKDEKVPQTGVNVNTAIPMAAGTGALAGLIAVTFVAMGKKKRED